MPSQCARAHHLGAFSLDTNGFEIIARCIIARTLAVYAALLIALRLAGKRELGQMTPFDLVVLPLISEAVQNSIIGGDLSLTGGLIAAGVLTGANYGLAAARERITRLHEALEGTPTVLVSDGRLIHKNLRREGVEEEDILMAAREHGIAGVRLAVLETDGSISVIPGERKPRGRSKASLFRKR